MPILKAKGEAKAKAEAKGESTVLYCTVGRKAERE
jgi:hypothetical protein